MKILVLSLLRIGDIVLSAPVLRGLRERYPDAEIHLLLNSQFAQVGALMPYIDRVIPFERERLQKGLGDAAVPVFESFDRLNDLVDDLGSEKYDWLINLTHNRLSGWLMSLIDCKSKTGLCFDAQGRASFGSSWFRYLNFQVDADGPEVFHFTDVFRFALGIEEDGDSSPFLLETESGKREAAEFLRELTGASADLVAVQPLTSDAKKNWGADRFVETIELIARANPRATFAILGAPFEKTQLEPLIAALEEKGVAASLAILSFEGAYSLLKSAKILLTGDTSIKHLACAARTPVVEVSLGSSDPYRTGAYFQGSVVVQSRESCAPCPHSKPCHRESHACAERIPVEAVAMAAGEVLAGRSFQLRAIADEFSDQIDILRVELRAAGYWTAYSVLEPFAEESIARWLDLSCRKIWLTGAWEADASRTSRMGTEILRLSNLLKTIHPEVSPIEWRHLLADFEKQAQMVEGRINGFKVGIDYLKGCYEDPRKMRDFVRGLITFRDRIRHSPFLRSFKMSLDQAIEDDISPAFTRFRRIVDLVGEIETRTEIHLRLIRGLMQVSGTEKGIEKL